jgi:hypothetical protein
MGAEQMISSCIETYRSFPLNEHEKSGLRRRIIEQNDRLIAPVYANVLTYPVQGTEQVNIISVGSGGSGDTEKDLDGQLRSRGKIINRWIGIEPYSSRTENSFLPQKIFLTLQLLIELPM